MAKPTFLTYEKPLLCAMIQCVTPDECIDKIKRSIAKGADALGVQLCKIERKYRTREEIKRIFAACEGKPIYITSYRGGKSEGMTDDECAELLLLGAECGATLMDVFGDMFDRSPYYELAEKPEAVEKQKALISKIHALGGEVLISSHTLKDISADECLMIAKKQIERGADVVKIVNRVEDKAGAFKQFEAIKKILENTDKRLLLLCSGEGKIVRYLGPSFGVCMYLCVESHGELDTPEQPTLDAIKPVRDNLIW